MPKVRSGGFLGIGAGEIDVPSMARFNQCIGEINDDKLRLWNELRRINENIGRVHEIKDIWRAIDQLTQSPNQPAEKPYDREIRKIYEDICNLKKSHEILPDAMRDTVREAVRAELKPLLESAVTNLDGLLKHNGELSSKTASLSNEVARCLVRVESAEKQFQKVPDTIAELQKLIDDAKANLKCAEVENSHLREEVTILRENLASCRKDIDELRNPPKKKGFFKRLFSRCRGFFQDVFLRNRQGVA